MKSIAWVLTPLLFLCAIPASAFEICELPPSAEALQKWHDYSKPHVDQMVKDCERKISEGKSTEGLTSDVDGLVNCIPDQFESMESASRADFVAGITLRNVYYDSETGEELPLVKAWHQFGSCAGSRLRRGHAFETVVFGHNGDANGEVVIRTRNTSAPLRSQNLHLRFLTNKGKPDIAKAQAFVHELNSRRHVTIGFVEGTVDENGIVDYPNFRILSDKN